MFVLSVKELNLTKPKTFTKNIQIIKFKNGIHYRVQASILQKEKKKIIIVDYCSWYCNICKVHSYMHAQFNHS